MAGSFGDCRLVGLRSRTNFLCHVVAGQVFLKCQLHQHEGMERAVGAGNRTLTPV